MKDKKALAGSLASFKADIQSSSGEGEGATPAPSLPPRVRPMTGPGGMALAGRELQESYIETREAQARVSELEAKVEELMQKQSNDLELDLNDLVIKPGRRRKLTLEQYNELKHNLANNTLATPVSVRALGGGRYELIAGHNRVDIYRELGRLTIRATVLDVSEDEASRLAFYTNLLSVKLTDYQQYLGFKVRLEESGKSLRELEAESGVSRSSISRLMSFDKLLPDLLAAIENAPNSDWFSAYAAEAIGRMTPPEQQKVLEFLPLLQAEKLSLSALINKVSLALAPKEKAAPAPRHEFKLGQKVVGELRHNNRGLSLTFSKTDILSPELVETIKTTVAEHLAAKK